MKTLQEQLDEARLKLNPDNKETIGTLPFNNPFAALEQYSRTKINERAAKAKATELAQYGTDPQALYDIMDGKYNPQAMSSEGDTANPFTNKSLQDDSSPMVQAASLPIQKPQIKPDISSTPVTPQPTSSISDPKVRDYIEQKFNLGKYSDENRKKLEEQSQLNFGDKAGAALAALGAGFMGQNAAAAGMNKLDSIKDQKRQALTDFDKGRNNAIQDFTVDREMKKADRDDEQLAREKDPNSQESKIAQQLAKQMGFSGDASTVTADKFKNFSPALMKMYEIEQKKLDRSESRDLRSAMATQKNDEKMQGLKTPYGLANTVDDAKQLKEAEVSKKNFDNKINEMIDLREKHNGGATFNREDVGRGKQLSKDLLLEYKNMAKLGVLSQSDENIINAIIPADPLEYNSPLASVQGQDPILHKLKSFKADSDKDFNTRLKTRLRDASQIPDVKESTTFPKQVRKGNQIATVSNEQELKEAMDEGFQ